MQTDKMAMTAVSPNLTKTENDANEECGSERPDSGSQFEEAKGETLARRSRQLSMVNVDNPILVSDMRRRYGVQLKKEMPGDAGKGEMDGTVYPLMY